jgi:hypothetical protein
MTRIAVSICQSMAPEPRELSEIYQQLFTSYQFSFLTKQSHVKYCDVMAVGEDMKENPSTLTPVTARNAIAKTILTAEQRTAVCTESDAPAKFYHRKKLITFETH